MAQAAGEASDHGAEPALVPGEPHAKTGAADMMKQSASGIAALEAAEEAERALASGSLLLASPVELLDSAIMPMHKHMLGDCWSQAQCPAGSFSISLSENALHRQVTEVANGASHM